MTANQAKQTTAKSRGWLLLAILAVLLVVAYVLDAPGMWLRSFAAQALKDRQPNAALQWVQRALYYAPQDTRAMLLASRANLQLGLNSRAQDFTVQASEHGHPNEVELMALQLMAQAQLGDLESAEQLLNWQRAHPLPPEALEAIVRCAIYNEEFGLAEMVLRQMQDQGELPSVVAYQQARILEVREDYANAAETYIQCFQTDANCVRAAYRAGACLQKLGEFQRAAEMFRHVTSPPYNAIGSIELAQCQWELDEIELAAQTIGVAVDMPPKDLQLVYLTVDEFMVNDRAALVAARIADRQDDSRRAIQLLQRVLDFNHRSFEARELLIKNLRKEGEVEEAEKTAEIQADMVAKRLRSRQIVIELSDDPNNLDKRCELAELYWYSESEAEARLALQEVLELDPNFERAHRLLAEFNGNE
ncbi:MAG: hypothetical protein R3C53_15755 [Pirellulaceae bacterium]